MLHTSTGQGLSSLSQSVEKELDKLRDKDPSICVEDVLFDIFKHNEADYLVTGDFLAALWSTGLRSSDPRLSELMSNLQKIQHDLNSHRSLEQLRLTREQFKQVVNENIVLISRAFRRQFVIPEFEEFTKQIETFYWTCKGQDGGKVASYIPQLERMNPNYWGLSLCTIDGQRYSLGDVKIPFTIQSCSKPLTYAIALNELGSETVHRYVGQEPSGRMFNELILDHNKKPHNPLINAGALITTSLILTLIRREMPLSDKFEFVKEFFKVITQVGNNLK